MLALPHHMDSLIDAQKVLPNSYQTIKGLMTGMSSPRSDARDEIEELCRHCRLSMDDEGATDNERHVYLCPSLRRNCNCN
jgi:endoglucanase Acf2